MGFTTKILLNTARIKTDGTYPLILRVTYNRKIVKLPLGHCIKEKDWHENKQQIKNSSKISSNITRLNTLLKRRQSEIYDRMSDLEISGLLKSMPPKELKAILSDTKNQEITNIYKYIDRLIAEKLATGKKGSALTYRGVKRKLNATFGEDLISFEQIDFQALKKIETKHLSDGGGFGGLGVNMRTLRAIYNRAIKDKIVSANFYPFKDYKIKTGDTERRALSEANFLKFRSLDLAPHLLQAKEYFMASFYMRGMNYIDMAHLEVKNIKGDFERISYQRNKTGKFFNIKISESLKIILKKHIENLEKKDRYVFPILTKDKSIEDQYETITNKRKRLNQKLKKIALTNDIEPFTIYTARHTYATMGKRKGVPTAVIQESLGHQTEAITQKYLSSFDNSVVDEYDELIMT